MSKEKKHKKESEVRYHSLIEASLDPLVTINNEGKITDMNEALVNITGVSRKKLTGSNFFDYFTEPEKAKEVYKEIFDKGFITNSPLTLCNKQGKLTDVLFNGSVYKDDKGTVLGVVIVARDIAEQKWATELRIANKELAYQNKEKEKRAAELGIANKELAFQNDEKEKRAEELGIANKELAFQNDEKEKRADELGIANKELAFQNDEKEKRAAELGVANEELAFQNNEKEKRAAELGIANKELAFQNDEKEKRAVELGIANKELNQSEKFLQNTLKEISYYKYSLDESAIIAITDQKGIIKKVNSNFCKISKYTEEELIGQDHRIINSGYHSNEFMRELWQTIANGKIWKGIIKNKAKDGSFYWVDTTIVPFLNDKGKPYQYLAIRVDITDRKESEGYLIQRTAELETANQELAHQNDDKEKRAAELGIANEELAFQNEEKEKRAAELGIANEELAFQNDEKEKRAAELGIANKELAFQNDEKEKRAEELGVANKELAFQNDEKEKRADELSIANEELAFQNDEKEKRADELGIANKELAFQNDEKEKRAAELIIANKELAFQNDEKEKRAEELRIANKELAIQNELKEKRAAELIIANKELIFQNQEKEKRAAELRVANDELAFQNKEKENRAEELRIANKELAFQNDEKEKRAEELRIANYARGLIEASRDPLVTISPEGKITDMNQATVNITGMSREKLKGTDFFDYFTEPQKAREVYQEIFAKGSVTDSPLTLKHQSGKLTDVLFHGSVYKDDLGNVLGVVVVARDITEQKRFENELIEAKSKAEHATHLAEGAVKAKQQFLSNMSHEIRTPMNAIIGFTKVVLKTELTAKQKEYLNAIKISGDALIVLINDILDLAKVDAGKMTFEQTPFKLSASISAMVHLFETKIQEKNLELVNEYDENIPEVLMGDPVRLHQVILNLVSNAVKFTSKGKITVSVRMLKEDKDKATIEFAVKDTGIGIPDDKIANIFDDFQQATSGTSRIYGGTGLGLAIVKALVEPQGGTISVKSKVGEGSTFSFILDFKKTNAKPDSEIDLAVEIEEGLNGIKVLVVEDIALNQLLMKTLLEEFGFEMDIASNGKIAIEKLNESNYDIILMDLQMPVMNGFEATEYIRKTMNLEIPIIALTADVTTVDVEKCKAVGMNDYISKPIDDKLLYNKIIKYLKKADCPETSENSDKKETPERKAGSCINLDYLRKLTKSEARLEEMIKIYLVEIPHLVTTMRKGIDDKNWQSLKIAAHSIIPSFLMMGIDTKYEDIAKKMQDEATILCGGKDVHEPCPDNSKVKKETIDLLNELFSELEGICGCVCEELKHGLALEAKK